MKKIILLAFLLLILASCSSDKASIDDLQIDAEISSTGQVESNNESEAAELENDLEDNSLELESESEAENEDSAQELENTDNDSAPVEDESEQVENTEERQETIEIESNSNIESSSNSSSSSVIVEETENDDSSTSELISEPEEGPVVIRTGKFYSTDIKSSGYIEIVRRDGKRYLEISNLDTKSGPDLKVFLGTNAGLQKESDLHAGKLLISPLSSNKGSSSYLIPDSVDIDDYKSVAIHCEQYNHSFAFADLK